MSTPSAYDRDEAFWEKIRALPEDVKFRRDVQAMLQMKTRAETINREIEHAIELRLAGWEASHPDGDLPQDRIFSWQWRKPGPRGGRLYLSTNQALNALRRGATPQIEFKQLEARP